MTKPLYVVGILSESGKRWHPAYVKGHGKSKGYASFTSKKYARKLAEDLKDRYPTKKIVLTRVV